MAALTLAKPKKAAGPRKAKDPKQAHPRAAKQSDQDLGQRIRLRRVELGITQAALAEKLGVSFQQVQKYEKGVNRVGAGRLTEIATALEVPVTFFYEDVGNKKRTEVESLLFLDSQFTLRLLRAYTAVKDLKIQRQFVSLIESVAGIEE